MHTVEPEPLAVSVAGRRVPAAVWRQPAGAAPLVLLGHGGSGHKTAPHQRALADRLVAAGLAVAAIDGPAHGERAPRPMAPSEYQADLVARGIDSVVRAMVDDWLATVGAARGSGVANGQLGYLGLSMGTRFGLPLAAALGDRLAGAVLGKFGLQQGPSLNAGLHDATELRLAAARVVAPTLWHVQWDDELFPRDGQLEMFDALGSGSKQLAAFPGDHGTTPDAAVDDWVAFLVRCLA